MCRLLPAGVVGRGSGGADSCDRSHLLRRERADFRVHAPGVVQEHAAGRVDGRRFAEEVAEGRHIDAGRVDPLDGLVEPAGVDELGRCGRPGSRRCRSPSGSRGPRPALAAPSCRPTRLRAGRSRSLSRHRWCRRAPPARGDGVWGASLRNRVQGIVALRVSGEFAMGREERER